MGLGLQELPGSTRVRRGFAGLIAFTAFGLEEAGPSLGTTCRFGVGAGGRRGGEDQEGVGEWGGFQSCG